MGTIVKQDRQCTYDDWGAFVQLLLQWKGNKYYVFWVCVSLAIVIKRAKRMRRIILSSVPVWLYHIFPHYLINGTIFGKEKKEWTRNLCWFSLELLSEIFSLQQDININTPRFSYKVPDILAVLKKLDCFSTDFQTVPEYQTPWKSVQWICAMRSGTHDTANSLFFRNFVTAPKNTRVFTIVRRVV